MKKTLLISSYAPPIIGGPQNMNALIRNLPLASYIILTSFYNIDRNSASSGTWLPGKYFFYDNPRASKNSIKQKKSSSSLETSGRYLINKLKYIAKQSVIIRTIIGIPIIFVQLFAIVRYGKRIIKEDHIESLMGFSDYGPAMLGTFFLHKITKKPFTIFFFDVYKGNVYPFPGNMLASIFEKKIVKAARDIIVTNKATAELYQKRYGSCVNNEIIIIHNSTPADYTSVSLRPYIKIKPPTIVFAGSIYWAQIGSLKNLVEAIRDTDIILKIYTPTPEKVLRQNNLITKNVKFLGSIPFSKIPQVQSDADLLFLPLAWNTKSQVIIDTATPGKFTDYLVAGRPFLIHAPKSSCVVKYARENNCALVVDKNDPVILKKVLTGFFEAPPEIGNNLVKNAMRFYKKNYDTAKNEKIFRSILQ